MFEVFFCLKTTILTTVNKLINKCKYVRKHINIVFIYKLSTEFKQVTH